MNQPWREHQLVEIFWSVLTPPEPACMITWYNLFKCLFQGEREFRDCHPWKLQRDNSCQIAIDNNQWSVISSSLTGNESLFESLWWEETQRGKEFIVGLKLDLKTYHRNSFHVLLLWSGASKFPTGDIIRMQARLFCHIFCTILTLSNSLNKRFTPSQWK